MTGSASPVRTCVGCRARVAKSDLLRVVAGEDEGIAFLIPDPRGRLPGRGASVHPTPECLDLAERRRAFPRALRLPGPLDPRSLRRWVDQQAPDTRPQADTPHVESRSRQR